MRQDSVIDIEENPGRPRRSEAPVVNIFLIYSPLHYLAAESVVANFERNARNYLFYLKREYQDLVDPTNWDAVNFLPWPRFYPEKGLLGAATGMS